MAFLAIKKGPEKAPEMFHDGGPPRVVQVEIARPTHQPPILLHEHPPEFADPIFGRLIFGRVRRGPWPEPAARSPSSSNGHPRFRRSPVSEGVLVTSHGTPPMQSGAAAPSPRPALITVRDSTPKRNWA